MPTGKIDMAEPLSSENKEVGWANFMHVLPKFLAKQRPSKIEIPVLHRIATSGTQHPSLPEAARQSAMELMIANEICRTRQETYDLVGTLRHNKVPNTKGGIRIGTKSGEVEIRYKTTMLLRGHLRQNGTIQVGQEPEKAVFAPHLKPYSTAETEEVYVGVTQNLDTLFGDFCDQADQHLAKASTLDEKLKAISYMQLWGSSTIHPFFDGNGRTFGAKMVLDLNRAGFALKAIPGLPELADLKPELEKNLLSTIGPHFASTFLDQSEIGLIPAEEVATLVETPEFFKAYMAQLAASIRVGFEAGPNAPGYVGQFIEASAHLLKMVLSRDGHIERSFYDKNIGPFMDFQRKAMR